MRLALVTALGHAEGSSDDVRAYCFVRVRGAMLDELRRLDTLSRSRRATVRAVSQAQTAFVSRNSREASANELADETGLPAGVVLSVLRAQAMETEGLPFQWDSMPDLDSPSPVENVEFSDLQTSLHAALERLPPNQARALRLYYLEEATLDEIAEQLGVSRERARQLREAGEKRLRVDFVVLSLWQTLVNET